MTEQNILSELAKHTDSGEHTKFQLLQNWKEYSFARKARAALKVLLKTLYRSVDNLFRNYCTDIVSGTADIHKLLAHNYTMTIISFYTEELMIITNMIHEYEAYLMEGHLLDAFFGEQRPAELMWDHRGL